MKKNDLIKKISVAGIILAMASSLCACGYSGANASPAYDMEPQANSIDYKNAGAGVYSYAAEEADYDDYYYDEGELYDGGGYGADVTSLSTPISETQANASVAKNRKLIKTVDMTIETTEFDATIASLRNKINSVGGYIENEYTYNGSLYNTNKQSKYANITVRVPDTALDSFVNDASGIGNVTQKTTSTNDVTLSYVDTESKKEMYKAEQESLLALLEKAETIEDITYLTQRLTEVRYNIESMESSLRVYDDLVDYATVNFNINEVKVLTPTVVEEKTPMQELKEGFVKSVKDVIVDARDFFINLIIKLPYIIRTLFCLAIPCLIIFIIVMIIIKANKKKKQKGKEYAESLKKDKASEEAKTEDKNTEKSEEKTENK